MVKVLLALVLAVVVSSSAQAEDCRSFASELDEPGERVAWFDEEGLLHIRDPDGAKTYGTLGAGTGVPWRAAQPIDGKGKELAFIFHKDDLIIDMEVFVPCCPK